MSKFLIPLGVVVLALILLAVFNPFNLHFNSLQSSAAPTAEKKSIAVLPFVNLSPEKENEYIGDGITDETITTLSQIPALRVTPLTTVMALRGSQK